MKNLYQTLEKKLPREITLEDAKEIVKNIKKKEGHCDKYMIADRSDGHNSAKKLYDDLLKSIQLKELVDWGKVKEVACKGCNDCVEPVGDCMMIENIVQTLKSSDIWKEGAK